MKRHNVEDHAETAREFTPDAFMVAAVAIQDSLALDGYSIPLRHVREALGRAVPTLLGGVR